MVDEIKRVFSVSAGGTKYQIIVIDTRAESRIRRRECMIFWFFLPNSFAMLLLKSSSTVWGQNQPHQILPKMTVTKAMKSRKNSTTPRIR